MLKLSLGTLFILIGVTLFSPIDELIIMVPLSVVFGAWIIPVWWIIAILCLGIGVYLAGRSKYIPNPIVHHIWIFVSVGVMVCAYFVYLLR